jgi:hypothetical protein
MAMKARNGFKIWTTLLSVFVALMLFPAIVGRRGVAKSLAISGLAVGATWLMYYGIGKIIEHAVSGELKKHALDQERNRSAEDTEKKTET